jgi:hypothetical protein
LHVAREVDDFHTLPPVEPSRMRRPIAGPSAASNRAKAGADDDDGR